jgi:hypothetical protein
MRSNSLQREASRRARLLSATALKHSRRLRLVAFYLRAHDRDAQPLRTSPTPERWLSGKEHV